MEGQGVVHNLVLNCSSGPDWFEYHALKSFVHHPLRSPRPMNGYLSRKAPKCNALMESSPSLAEVHVSQVFQLAHVDWLKICSNIRMDG